MRNYVIINGKKSDYIRGLIIQELPPITLPPMRTEIIEIEGRDGDIVEKLGYQAYDKEFTIGLYGDYDVNQIISYFAQSGSIIFSNEPDKYYQFEMINQIDLERLIRYKTATITLHVQPFKYSAINEYYNYTGGIIPYSVYEDDKNGLTLFSYGKIKIVGTATASTSFSIPINLVMKTGERKVKIKASGTGTVSVGLYDGASYFAGGMKSVTVGEIIIEDTIIDDTEYTELKINIQSSTVLELSLEISLAEIEVWNDGNVHSLPIYTIQGDGMIGLTINDNLPFFINLSGYSAIVINTEKLDAYYNETNMNRMVSGDYRDLQLKSGYNSIVIDGDVQQIIIEKYERWL